MGFVRLAQAGHPELEKFDIVLLCSSQNAQQFLGILLGSAVHFSEFKEDFHLLQEQEIPVIIKWTHTPSNREQEELELLLAPTALNVHKALTSVLLNCSHA